MTLGKALTAAVLSAAALYMAYLGLLYFSQTSIIYPGTKNHVAAIPSLPRGAGSFRIQTALGNIDAFFLPAEPADASRHPLVIFAHGNGEVIDDWSTALDGFRQRGVGVLLVEYPGYGRSTGSPSEASIEGAMDAAYDRIAADSRVDASRIFGFGQSLGGGAICLLAKDRNLRALILQSTFTSLDGFAAKYWAPAFLLRDHFESLATLTHFRGPVLVIHGRDDRLIAWTQGQRLAAASPRSTFKLYDCGHGCWDPERLPFWRDAEPFLKESGVLLGLETAN